MSNEGASSRETQVSDDELASLAAGELDESTQRQLRARIALDPTAGARLAALRAGVRLTNEQQAALQQRLADQPDLAAEDLEMSDETAARIAAAIDAAVGRRPPQPD